jgi:hypothetical protein
MKTIFTLLFLISLVFATQAQVNGYASVTSIQSQDKLTISVSNETYGQFRKQGYVIIMQMQDNVIGGNILNDINFGNLATIASAGEYEVARISNVKRNDADPDDDDEDNNSPILEIKLTGNLAKTFITGANSSVQVITFPTLGSSGFTTTSDISALPWNGSYGGVVAFEVSGVLTLNHNINVDNAGFRGGVMDASSSPYGTCAPNTYFTAVNALFGNKGEGIYKSVNSSFFAGKGKIANGGGGGNTINGGGSGGGNFSGGGNGGAGWSCSNSGGIGGVSLNSYIGATRIFLGGGGGSGESNDHNNNKGGNGGGIIIVKAQAIRTTGTGTVRISANGQAGNNVSNDGAGGGGAGGSIAFQVNTWNIAASKPLQITANGGNGGNVNTGPVHGGGGGGGQGAILFNVSVPAVNITVNTLNGTGGLNNIGGTRAGNGGGVINQGIMQNAFAILPVKLISFQGYKNRAKVELDWITQNEINVSRFEIQRSANGTSFSVIGVQQAVSNNQSVNSYTHMDAQPLAGANYYRLRMIDNDGRFSYSKVLLIRADDQSKTSIGIYPNPAVAQATLSFKSETTRTATVHILNMKGAVVAKQQVQVVTGENALALNGISHLSAGVYTVQLIINNTSHHTRLFVAD